MSAETLQHTWEWLLGLSKIQLILLGGALSLLVAISKVLRFFFLIGVLVLFLTTFLPAISKWYEHSPLSTLIGGLIRQGVEATKDPQPANPQPANNNTGTVGAKHTPP